MRATAGCARSKASPSCNAPDRSRLGEDIRTEAQDRARAALKARI